MTNEHKLDCAIYSDDIWEERICNCGAPPEQSASWVVRERATKRVIMETSNASLAAKVNIERYEVVPIREYLGEVNRTIREASKLGGTRTTGLGKSIL